MMETRLKSLSYNKSHRGLTMKVAVISPLAVLPAVEGNRSRILTLTRQLRGLGADVHLILVPTRDVMICDQGLHQQEMGDGRFTVLPRHGLSGLRHLSKRLFSEFKRLVFTRLRIPGWQYHALDEYFYEASLKYLRQMQHEHHFDAVFVEYVFCSKALLAFGSDVLKVLDTHDVFADRHLLFAPDATPLSYWFSVPHAREDIGLLRADIILAIQEEEADIFKGRLPEGSIVKTVSHALALGEPVCDFTPKAASFIGSASPPNIDAVNYFINEVLPLVLRVIPEFRLFVAGSVCKAIQDHPAVTKLGRVEHVSEVYRIGPVSINPMRIGTGINIKLLEAMAHGAATVSTYLGARGLGTAFRQGVIVVPDGDAAGFAHEVISLMENLQAREALGKAAFSSAALWNAQQNEALADVLSHCFTQNSRFLEKADAAHRG